MARKLRSDEFEARQRQLPATNKRFLGGANMDGARVDLSQTPLGAPPVDYDVRSIYDVRPVGAWDFNILGSRQFTSIGNNSRLIEMTVPDGLIAVLRTIDIWMEPIPLGAAKTAYTWSLALNGGDVPGNQLIPFGIAVDGERVFLLGNENNRLGVRIGGSAVALEGVIGYARFYGTLQIKGDIPLPFEIANSAASRTPKRFAPPTLPSAPPAPLVRSSRQPDTVLIQPLPAKLTEPAPSRSVSRPPFDVRLANVLIRGVRSRVPVKARGGGFVPLTDQESATYAEFIATLR